MKKKTIRLQELVGSLVRDVNGEKVGHIRCVHTEEVGADCVISHFELGTAALLSRFGISAIHLFGLPIRRHPLFIPWHQLDLSDPKQPRLLCAREELKSSDHHP